MDRGAAGSAPAGQLSLFGDAAQGAATAGAARGVLRLGERLVEYRLARARRRSLAIVVDQAGLALRAPPRAPWPEIESYVRAHERWILRKLDEWAAPRRAAGLRGVDGEALPLFGAPVRLALREGPRGVSVANGRLVVTLAEPRRRARVLALLRGWLRACALEALAPRVEHYAARLGLAAPRVALSNARRQWGVCQANGRIRLNWRLVHLERGLADYVVAHEVAHLVHMNHSKRFWALVATLYPDWREARARLERAAAALPSLGETA